MMSREYRKPEIRIDQVIQTNLISLLSKNMTIDIWELNPNFQLWKVEYFNLNSRTVLMIIDNQGTSYYFGTKGFK